VPGYDWSDFSLDTLAWDDQHWSDTVTYTASGPFEAAAGVTYRFANESTSNSWWDSTRTWTAGADEGAGTETVTDAFGGSYRTDVIVSDRADNFSGPTGYDANGYPTNLFSVPAADTTFLARWFDAGSYGGTTVRATTFSPSALSGRKLTEHNSYDGVNAFRLFSVATETTGTDLSNPDVPPVQDKTTRRVDHQEKGTYGGGRDAELTSPSNPLIVSGTATDWWFQTADVPVDRYEFTDEYIRLGLDGTRKVSISDPGHYHAEETHETTYAGGNRTVDKISYRSEGSHDREVISSDNQNYIRRFRQTVGSGAEYASMKGTRFTSASDREHEEWVDAGTRNLLDNTVVADSSSDYNGSTASLAVVTGTYKAYDGTVTQNFLGFSLGAGSYSGKTIDKGTYRADGRPKGGTFFSHAESSDREGGFFWSKITVPGAPTLAALTTFTDTSSQDATGDLSFDADGKASGTLTSTVKEASDTDATVTLKGEQKLYDLAKTQIGTGHFDDRSHTKDHIAHTLTTGPLTLAADLPSGTVKVEDVTSTTYDFKVDHQVDRDDDTLHATSHSNGDGSIKTTDTVTTTLSNGTPTTSRILVFTKKGDSNSTLSAHGTLSDAAGHTGQWNTTGRFPPSDPDKPLNYATNHVNDKVTSYFTWGGSGWTETGREFEINESSKSQVIFHQADNGLGWPAPPAGTTETRSHMLDTRLVSDHSTSLEGTPSNFKFQLKRYDSQVRDEFDSGGWNTAGTGETRSYTRRAVSSRLVNDYHEGTSEGTGENRKVNETKLAVNHVRSDSNEFDASNSSPSGSNEMHSRTWREEGERRSGKTGDAPGDSWVTTLNQAWWKSSLNGRTESGGNPDAKPVTVRKPWPPPDATLWGVLWDDFTRDPGVKWLYNNGADVLRIVGGTIDVVVGLGFLVDPCPLTWLAGFGLITVGADQIVTGVANLTSGRPGPSVVEYAGYSAARGLGFDEQTSQTIGAFTPLALSVAFNLAGSLAACFAAGTPLRTPTGDKPIEEFRPGDLILSRAETDPDGPLEAKTVEKVFVRTGRIMNLHVGGQVIRTTAEHPFWVQGRGWLMAGQLRAGDPLLSHDGKWVTVEEVFDTEEYERVYNLRIGDYHTYFVGSRNWDFSVWAHNLNCAEISAVGRGIHGNQEAMRIAGEIQGATSQAVKTLRTGGTGGTVWGRIYQLAKGAGWFGGKTWLEPIFRGNAIHQIAWKLLQGNRILEEAGVIFNQGSRLGTVSRAGNLLRPDFQVLLSKGKWAIFDITTAGEAPKIFKYENALAPYLINIVYH
jgi:Pretoxin HINT domain